ncbi:MAG: hypothetical protein LBJ35_04145 [Spirochaetaceae bacterium]|nr:hypothetical protein [Spirochaetaceae bacterium]
MVNGPVSTLSASAAAIPSGLEHPSAASEKIRQSSPPPPREIWQSLAVSFS